jgi:hypothetical protein
LRHRRERPRARPPSRPKVQKVPAPSEGEAGGSVTAANAVRDPDRPGPHCFASRMRSVGQKRIGRTGATPAVSFGATGGRSGDRQGSGSVPTPTLRSFIVIHVIHEACWAAEKGKPHNESRCRALSCPSWARTRTLLIQRGRGNQPNSSNLLPFTRARVTGCWGSPASMLDCRGLLAQMSEFAWGKQAT